MGISYHNLHFGRDSNGDRKVGKLYSEMRAKGRGEPPVLNGSCWCAEVESRLIRNRIVYVIGQHSDLQTSNLLLINLTAWLIYGR